MRTVDFRVCLVTDRITAAFRGGLRAVVEAALDGGIDAVQLREKDLSPSELLPIAEELRALTAERGAMLLVNDRIDVALAVGADGVHLRATSLPVAAARKVVGPDMIIGVSLHQVEEIPVAAEHGADYVQFGAVFPTMSKGRNFVPLGMPALRQACKISPIPVFAVGGVTPATVTQSASVGARVCAISAFTQGDDATAVADAFVKATKVCDEDE